jgi:hypothetical protein
MGITTNKYTMGDVQVGNFTGNDDGGHADAGDEGFNLLNMHGGQNTTYPTGVATSTTSTGSLTVPSLRPPAPLFLELLESAQ